MDGSWLLDELGIGREHDEGCMSVTGGTLLSLAVSSDVMAVNGSWLLDELVLGQEHDEGRISMTGRIPLSLGVSSDVMAAEDHSSLAALWVFLAMSH